MVEMNTDGIEKKKELLFVHMNRGSTGLDACLTGACKMYHVSQVGQTFNTRNKALHVYLIVTTAYKGLFILSLQEAEVQYTSIACVSKNYVLDRFN